MSLGIRRFSPKDSVPELTGLLHRAYRSLAAQGFRYFATYQNDSITRDRISQGECFIALKDGKIVGTITLTGAENTRGSRWYDRPEVASFGQYAVDPDLQGTGIGSKLLETVERRAAELEVKELALDTAEGAMHLIQLYLAHGYRFIEYIDWDETNYRSVVMSKTLQP